MTTPATTCAPLRTTLDPVGIVRIALDHGDYSRLDDEMTARGYATTVSGEINDDGLQRLFALPRGTYWREEPTDPEAMVLEARAAAIAAVELGAQIVVTSGASAWHGLTPLTWPS